MIIIGTDRRIRLGHNKLGSKRHPNNSLKLTRQRKQAYSLSD